MDIIIPTCEKDIQTLSICVEKVKKYIKHCKTIYVVCSPTLFSQIPNGVQPIDEDTFPFTIAQVTSYPQCAPRPGWFFQQLLKLYAWVRIPSLTPTYMVIDSETLFYRPYDFLEPIPTLFMSNEVNLNYREHIKRVLPELPVDPLPYSCITHMMVFQTPILKHLFEKILIQHNGKEPWKVLLEQATLYGGMSEYELYFHFMRANHPSAFQLKNELWDLTINIPESSPCVFLTKHAHLQSPLTPFRWRYEPYCMVTAYFPMSSKYPQEIYFQAIERFVRSCPQPTIFFTPAELIPRFEAFRTQQTAPITFVPFTIQEFEAWKFGKKNEPGQDFWTRQRARDDERAYHTEPLAAVWYEKPHFVLKAAKLLQAKVYVWIDAGSVRSDQDEKAFQQFLKRPYPYKQPLHDDRIHLQKIQDPKVGLGFFKAPFISLAGAIEAGTKSAWERHQTLYDIQLKEYDEAGVSGNSDQYVTKRCVLACPGLYVEHMIPEKTSVCSWHFFLETL
jgi:hypothetical protein